MSATDSRAIYPSLKGKRVFITGGGSGIGEALVEAFCAQGARVAFVDIADQASRDLVERLCDAPHKPVYRQCDITDIDALKATIAEIESQFGGIDVLVNNAANDDRHTVEDVTP
jgi:NAD(P)-dependent dehydrogenase (short-subunit alcohol dehydrogenase family)